MPKVGAAKIIALLRRRYRNRPYSGDGRSLYIALRGEMPALVYRLELATGHKNFWTRLMPPDPAGVNIIFPILLTPDGKSQVYGYRRILSDLTWWKD